MVRNNQCLRVACFLSLLVSAPLTGVVFAGSAVTTQDATPSDQRLDMIRTLQALGPSPSLGEKANIFGRFVGTWDVDYGNIAENGKVTHFQGELVVGWVMDGHATQDLFIAYLTPDGKERAMGTTLRFFDAKLEKWHIVYIEPPTNSVQEMTGGQEGDRIVLYGKDQGGTLLRWSFNEIKDDSFVWRGEKSRDGGKTWRPDAEHHMKRRTGTSAERPAVNQFFAREPVATQGHALCPVCHMEVDPTTSAKSVYKGKTYYLMNEAHKQSFDADPEKYLDVKGK